MSKAERREPHFDFDTAKEHFEQVHESIARGELDRSVADLKIYTNFGLRCVSVSDRLTALNQGLNEARLEHHEATDGMSLEEIYRALFEENQELRQRIDENRRKAASNRVVRLWFRGQKLEAEHKSLEGLFDLIKEPWPVIPLSPRAKFVFELISQGTEDGVISQAAGETFGQNYTLKEDKEEILSATGAKTLEQAIFVGFRYGILQLEETTVEPTAQISGSEDRVLNFLCQGWTELQIAKDLRTSTVNIRSYIEGYTQKLGAHDRYHAVQRGIAAGLWIATAEMESKVQEDSEEKLTPAQQAAAILNHNVDKGFTNEMLGAAIHPGSSEDPKKLTREVYHSIYNDRRSFKTRAQKAHKFHENMLQIAPKTQPKTIWVCLEEGEEPNWAKIVAEIRKELGIEEPVTSSGPAAKPEQKQPKPKTAKKQHDTRSQEKLEREEERNLRLQEDNAGQRSRQLEKRLRAGILILQALNTGIEAEEIARRTGIPIATIENIRQEAKRAYKRGV